MTVVVGPPDDEEVPAPVVVVTAEVGCVAAGVVVVVAGTAFATVEVVDVVLLDLLLGLSLLHAPRQREPTAQAIS